MVIGYQREGEGRTGEDAHWSSNGASGSGGGAQIVTNCPNASRGVPVRGRPIRQEFGGLGKRGRQLLLPFEEDHIRVLRFSQADRTDRRRSTIWREGKVLYADFGRGGECA